MHSPHELEARILPRYAADYRTLLWVLLAVLLLGVQFAHPECKFYLTWLSCYFAMSCGIIAHNHNHCPVFASRRMNNGLGHLLSIFYGYPTFVWIPTHNLNHHKHVNRAGDATITWRFSDRHNLVVASTYFFVSAYFQAAPVNTFIRKAKLGDRRLYRRILLQYAVWLGVWLALLLLAIGLHGLRQGVVLWLFAVGLPSLFTLWVIMLFNYEQHVHTDPWSDHNHSRNFTSGVLNFLLFNNGYHGVHHDRPGMHWSLLPGAHAEIASQIDAQLNQRSMWWYFAKQFVGSKFHSPWGTQQVGRSPFDPPDGSTLSLEADDVQLGEAGTNAVIAR
jgi:beta-carotene hydroxylase